jgi:RNA polymerase sigma-70 factor (TIGR02960 family)
VTAEALERYRGELQLHCYRIVGSLQDAEDLVQETLLAAWRGLDGFEERSSMRTWLYRIATNRSLNFLRDRGRRPLPAMPPVPEATSSPEPLWLDPYPDELYEQREAIGLAFMSALQEMPPRQRAVLVLRDVLGFRAAEVAEMLEIGEGAVTSALHRARSAAPRSRDEAPLPGSPGERAVVARFTQAFSDGDVAGVVALLTADARLTMPPFPLAYDGPEAIAGFLSSVPAGGRLDLIELVETRANGQPAFGTYLDGERYGIMVLTLRGERISAITGFTNPDIFPSFGLT